MKRTKTLLLFIFCSIFQKCSHKKEPPKEKWTKYNPEWFGETSSGYGIIGESSSWKTGEYVILKDGGRSIKKDSL